ncbi:hypothetical protein C7964_101102 [Loktanella sp. PT4BL]|uniref:hypothetical protein n=1 Tax=Loktanella sp. PT4BL TaxID=2135611 RepID=UPI000D76D29E|nr:hypothetical protein [Loktanella sp. PT4BL]PXW71996.1 hypothetical protein C7964_101102 [Loktanella sp. PT4BL]
MTDFEYYMALPAFVILAGIIGHVFRGLWRPFAPRGNPARGISRYERYRAQSKSDLFFRDAFSIDDIWFRVDLDSECFYELASLRNLIISIINWAIAAFLIWLFLWDRAEPVYANLVEDYMTWKRGG